MKKILLVTLCAALAIGSVGCDKKSDKKEQKEAEKKLTNTQIEEIFDKIEAGECKTDNNIFTWLEPTHKQSADYPYDYIYEYWCEDAKTYLEEVGDLIWSPNKPIIIDENISYVRYAGKKYSSFDEILDKKVGGTDTLEVRLDAEKAGVDVDEDIVYIASNIQFEQDINSNSESPQLKTLIEKNVWRYLNATWHTQWFFEDKMEDATQLEVLEQLVKDWGMPTEVYYNANDEVGTFTYHYAILFWDCDGYDFVYRVKEGLGMFEITSVDIYGDGWSDYFNQEYFDIDKEGYKAIK